MESASGSGIDSSAVSGAGPDGGHELDMDAMGPTGTRSRRSTSTTNTSDAPAQILPSIETRLRSSTNPLLGPEADEEAAYPGSDPDSATDTAGTPTDDGAGTGTALPLGVGLGMGGGLAVAPMLLPTISENEPEPFCTATGYPASSTGSHQIQASVSTEDLLAASGPEEPTAAMLALEIGAESPMQLQGAARLPLMQRALTYMRYLLSSGLSLAYLGYIFWGILTRQAVLPGPAVVHLLLFLLCLLLIAYLEGLKIAILAVEQQSPETHRQSHPRAFRLMNRVREGNVVERFLVGRQFLTIFVMTLMAQVTSFPAISHLGVSPVLWFVLVQTGLPGAMVVTTVGSLQPQLLAAKDPWRFLDLPGSVLVLDMCCAAEFSGVGTHFAWMLIALLRRSVFVSTQPLKPAAALSPAARACEALKYVVSSAVVLLSLAFVMFGIWTGEAILPLPPVGVFCTLVFCFVSLSFLEGLQVAVLVAESVDAEGLLHSDSHPRAHALMRRALQGKNVRRFLVGRQFFVVFIVFLVNQCTIFPGISHMGINPVLWLVVVQLGLPTALCVLCFAQLPAQLLANQDAVLFMNRPGPALALELCLLMESTGLVHFAWVLAAASRATWFRSARGTEEEAAGQQGYSDLRPSGGSSSTTALNEMVSSSSSGEAGGNIGGGDGGAPGDLTTMGQGAIMV